MIPAALKSEVSARLDALRQEHDVPGAVLGVMAGDEVWDCAAGVLNVNTGVEATTDSLFQIGSITKTYTATMIMQLVDEGRLDLDAPVTDQIPALKPSAEGVTARHLLAHSSGIDGDFFDDFGRGDDCLERYVDACAGLPRLFEPGEMYSYCNAGFVIAGRLIEIARNEPWDASLARLAAALGTPTLVSLPEQVLLHRAAAGHEPAEEGGIRVVRQWYLPRSTASCGATPCATARDLMSFVRMHLAGGRARDGTEILSRASADTMRGAQIQTPGVRAGNTARGLGWYLDRWSEAEVFGHDGETIGQTAYLRCAPRARVAAALLTNGYNSQPLYEELFGLVFSEIAGLEVPRRPKPPETSAAIADPGRYEGTYERVGVRTTITWRDGGLFIHEEFSGIMADLTPEVEPQRLIAGDDETFFAPSPLADEHIPVFFLGTENGRAGYFYDGRIAPRVR